MDNVVNRLAKELAEAIGSAVADDPRVEACREKARAAGYEMRVSLEAEIAFGTRDPEPLAKVSTARAAADGHESQSLEITANDRRFLRSIRIAES